MSAADHGLLASQADRDVRAGHLPRHDLDPAGRPGLGAHAHAAFGVPVTGVAKTRFRTATHAVQVLRGRPARPLFATAAAMPPAQAASLVRQMAGPFRLPDALRRADALARTGNDHTTAARPETR